MFSSKLTVMFAYLIYGLITLGTAFLVGFLVWSKSESLVLAALFSLASLSVYVYMVVSQLRETREVISEFMRSTRDG